MSRLFPSPAEKTAVPLRRLAPTLKVLPVLLVALLLVGVVRLLPLHPTPPLMQVLLEAELLLPVEESLLAALLVDPLVALLVAPLAVLAKSVALAD